MHGSRPHTTVFAATEQGKAWKEAMNFKGPLEMGTNDDDAAIALAAWACQQRIVIALMCAAQEQRFVGQQKLAAPATS